MNKLAELRNNFGLTQEQLSDRSGVARMQISRIERGVISLSNISLKNAAALARVLGIHAEDLLEAPAPDKPVQDNNVENDDFDDELE